MLKIERITATRWNHDAQLEEWFVVWERAWSTEQGLGQARKVIGHQIDRFMENIIIRNDPTEFLLAMGGTWLPRDDLENVPSLCALSQE